VITQKFIDDLRSKIDSVRPLQKEDTFARDLVLVGVNYLSIVVMSKKNNKPLDPLRENELNHLINNYQGIVDDYLIERNMEYVG
jgi:hypothetical protein